jgi:hypothetical protein
MMGGGVQRRFWRLRRKDVTSWGGGAARGGDHHAENCRPRGQQAADLAIHSPERHINLQWHVRHPRAVRTHRPGEGRREPTAFQKLRGLPKLAPRGFFSGSNKSRDFISGYEECGFRLS